MRNSFKILLLIACFAFNISFAQYSLQEDIIDWTVLIEIGNTSSGSGFFYQDSGFLYLVTAKHVIITEENINEGKKNFSLRDSIGVLKFYARDSDKSKVNEIRCNLLTLVRQGNLKFSKADDVLVIKIGQIVFDKIHYIQYVNGVERKGKSSTLNGFDSGFVDQPGTANLGDDVFIMGYPKALGLRESSQFDFDRPLLRKGALAGRNSKNNTLIIDCPSYGGNSGGPVILVSYDKKVKLIGIVVSFIPFAENWVNLNYGGMQRQIHNSGYSVVEPFEKIQDLIIKINN